MYLGGDSFTVLGKNKGKKRKALLLIIKSLDPKLYKKARKILKEGRG